MSANAPALPDDRLLTTREAALFLRLSTSSLERMRLAASGPEFLKLGPGKRARVVYRMADLLAWLDGQRFRSTSEYAQPREAGGDA